MSRRIVRERRAIHAKRMSEIPNKKYDFLHFLYYTLTENYKQNIINNRKRNKWAETIRNTKLEKKRFK